MFMINETEGVIYTVTVLDREKFDSIDLTVEVGFVVSPTFSFKFLIFSRVSSSSTLCPIWSFCGPSLLEFGLNKKIKSISFCIQCKCIKSPNTDMLHEVSFVDLRVIPSNSQKSVFAKISD